MEKMVPLLKKLVTEALRDDKWHLGVTGIERLSNLRVEIQQYIVDNPDLLRDAARGRLIIED